MIIILARECILLLPVKIGQPGLQHVFVPLQGRDPRPRFRHSCASTVVPPDLIFIRPSSPARQVCCPISTLLVRVRSLLVSSLVYLMSCPLDGITLPKNPRKLLVKIPVLPIWLVPTNRSLIAYVAAGLAEWTDSLRIAVVFFCCSVSTRLPTHDSIAKEPRLDETKVGVWTGFGWTISLARCMFVSSPSARLRVSRNFPFSSRIESSSLASRSFSFTSSSIFSTCSPFSLRAASRSRFVSSA